jgi:uncharacterized protein (TIGR00369 family)
MSDDTAAVSTQPLTTHETMTGKASGFRALLGYRVAEWREGFAALELQLDQRHMNSLGIVHGGLYATLLDAACGHAATWCAVPGHTRVCVTVSLTTSFLGSVSAGHIRTVGRLERIDRRIAVCRAEVLDQDGRILAIGQGSFRYGSGSETVTGIERPSAFV